jgi:hypothetical protein
MSQEVDRVTPAQVSPGSLFGTRALSLREVLGRSGRDLLRTTLEGLGPEQTETGSAWERIGAGGQHYRLDLTGEKVPESLRGRGVSAVRLDLRLRDMPSLEYSAVGVPTTQQAALRDAVRNEVQQVATRAFNQLLATSVAQRLQERLRTRTRLTTGVQQGVGVQVSQSGVDVRTSVRR